LTSKYTEIGGIRVAERHLLIFFFIPTPTGYPKEVQKGLVREKRGKYILPPELFTPI
jgi:hypothetical protein